MDINIKIDELIYPYFVVEGKNKDEEIESFPGQFRFSIDRLIEDLKEAVDLGLNRILLFGIPKEKDAAGSAAYRKDNIISCAVKTIKKKFPQVEITTDVCLCAYTDHGHCGVLKKLEIDNKKTLEALAQIALSYAEAGADYVAPSAMAKGQVAAIRNALDENGYRKTKILGYSAKFASNFYGPFRNAALSSPKFGDRKSYQLDYRYGDKAIEEIGNDIEEGADMVMVKPAIGYLDIMKEAKSKFSKPLVAYNVSGEYSLVKMGAEQGLWNEKSAVSEVISSIKRAGADHIITYHAKDVAKWLKE